MLYKDSSIFTVYFRATLNQNRFIRPSQNTLETSFSRHLMHWHVWNAIWKLKIFLYLDWRPGNLPETGNYISRYFLQDFRTVYTIHRMIFYRKNCKIRCIVHGTYCPFLKFNLHLWDKQTPISITWLRSGISHESSFGRVFFQVS